jgi:hypothetical protein
MNENAILEKNRSEIIRVSKLHGVKNILVFGSVARGDAGPESDIDFLVCS